MRRWHPPRVLRRDWGRPRLGDVRRWGARLVLLVIAGALWWPVQAFAVASAISATGTVSGELQQGQVLSVRLSVQHSGGWQEVSEIEVDLELRGKALEQLVIDPTHY